MNTLTPQQDLLNTQLSTENQNTLNLNSSQLVDKEHIEGTGFDIVGNQEHGYFVALGRYRLTQQNKDRTKEQCLQMIINKDWELIIGLISANLLFYNENQEAFKPSKKK